MDTSNVNETGVNCVPEENFKKLLINAIKHKNKTALKNIPYETDQNKFKEGVQKLRPSEVVPVVEGLCEVFKDKSCQNAVILWLKCIFQYHENVLLTHPGFVDGLKPVLAIVDRKLLLKPHLNKLKGRLDLLLHQIEGASCDASKDEGTLLFNGTDSNTEDELELEPGLNNVGTVEWNEEYTDEEVETDEDGVDHAT